MTLELGARPLDTDGTSDEHGPPAPRRLERIGLGVVAGLVSAGAGLAVAEVVTAVSARLQSPVIDVGDLVVDRVPNSVKTLAIEWFGENDKRALLVGIAVILGLYAAVLGAVAIGRRWQVAIVGTALFGAIGAYASQSTRRPAPWWAVAPSLAGGVVAAAALVALRRALLGRPASSVARAEPAAPPLDGAAGVDRRRFLVAAGGTAAGAAIVGRTGQVLAARDDVGAELGELVLPRADDPIAPIDPGAAAGVPGVTPFVTPNDDFYRIDTALTVPQVSVNGWRLDITGLVDRPFSASYPELLEREIVEADVTIACVSNEIGGRLIGNARWLGVRLDDLLAEAGIDPSADQIVGRSVDGFTAGFPTSAATDGRNALVAIGMNGEPLPVEHGYPARLIVPGLYGYVSATKWLREIELTRFADFDAYWIRRGWAIDGPIKLQSRIDTPRGLSTVPAGRVAIAGVAWAQARGIDAVEVQIDDGEWTPARLATEHSIDTWRQWSFAWDAVPGRHAIRVRATERGGAVQTADRADPFPDGATGRHQIVVIVE